ncbi:MAG: YifB family Mg chelatase-like AAA ATPase [Bacteroidales bacterium]|nr:YifB family Mg chelatase-like AAA ATPase [Bacteroidales bacterium]
MLTRTYSAKCVGIDAVKVTVEINVGKGIGIHLVGLADAAVKESLLRTMTAMQALGYHIPGKRIVINLAPADMHKSGSGYDLPIAAGIIAATEQKALPLAERYLMSGELGLDGSVRAISGALPFAELAEKEDFDGIILPVSSALEAAELNNKSVYGVRNLQDVVRILEDIEDRSDLLVWNSAEYKRIISPVWKSEPVMDFADIVGQEGAKRGMEIAASGGHNIIMVGPPGSGKSSLAKALAGILPPMTREESLVTSKIFSIAGKGSMRYGLMDRRPFRAPHYSASLAAIIGGGAGDGIIPGEISLAQNGVLFLDEMSLMPKSVIEALRGPIEDRRVVISRLKAKVEYPASFMLVAASNPCPCGYYGVPDRCTCSVTQRLNYMARLSGPIMDRIDLQVTVAPVPGHAILGAPKAEPSAAVAARVLRAREIQRQRFKDAGIQTNAEMTNKLIERFCPLSQDCQEVLVKLMDKLGLSMRAYFRIIRVARTIADLAGAPAITVPHLTEAAGYRFLDRMNILK